MVNTRIVSSLACIIAVALAAPTQAFAQEMGDCPPEWQTEQGGSSCNDPNGWNTGGNQDNPDWGPWSPWQYWSTPYGSGQSGGFCDVGLTYTCTVYEINGGYSERCFCDSPWNNSLVPLQRTN